MDGWFSKKPDILDLLNSKLPELRYYKKGKLIIELHAFKIISGYKFINGEKIFLEPHVAKSLWDEYYKTSTEIPILENWE